MPIGNKLQTLIRLRKRKVSDLAQELGVSASTVYSIIRRDNQKADPALLRRLAEALDVPFSYFFDDDSPLSPAALSPSGKPAFGRDPSTLPGFLAVSKKRIPLLGSVAAGKPIYASEDCETYLESNVPCDFALRVSGDSMEPLILKDDIVFVRSQPDVSDGQIAVILVDDEATLKRVYHLPTGVQLVSLNPSYAPMLFDETNSSTLSILGRAVAFKRDL